MRLVVHVEHAVSDTDHKPDEAGDEEERPHRLNRVHQEQKSLIEDRLQKARQRRGGHPCRGEYCGGSCVHIDECVLGVNNLDRRASGPGSAPSSEAQPELEEEFLKEAYHEVRYGGEDDHP